MSVLPDPFPRSAVLAWWGTGWLQGQVSADDVADVLGGVGVIDLLAEARLTGATVIGLALPMAGDLLGLGGPREFNDAALARGEAAIADSGTAWIPVGHGWERYRADRRQLPDVGEADRRLRHSVLQAAETLATLDVASWRPELADALMDWRAPVELPTPPGLPVRCTDLAARALRARQVVDLAMSGEDDDGSRRVVLDELDRSARQALVAACSPEVWPPR